VLDAASDLIEKAKALSADPKNAALASALERSYATLDGAVQELLVLANLQDTNLIGKIHFATKYAFGLSDMLREIGSVEKNARLIEGIVENITDDAKKYAVTLDAETAAKVEKNCGNLKVIASYLSAAAGKWAQSGGDVEFSDLDKKRELFQRAIQIFRTSVGLAGLTFNFYLGRFI